MSPILYMPLGSDPIKTRVATYSLSENSITYLLLYVHKLLQE